jgi:hypothetical protein
VLLEKGPIRRVPVDVDLLDVDVLLRQKTPGVTAGRSRGFPVEARLGHPAILPSVAVELARTAGPRRVQSSEPDAHDQRDLPLDPG